MQFMQFIKPDINIDFIGKRKIAYSLSGALLLITIVSLIINSGPKYGVDFAGGTVIQIKFNDPVTIDNIKKGLNAVGVKSSSVQTFGENKENEYLIHTDSVLTEDQAFSSKLQTELKSATGKESEIRRIETVGPQGGKDLREKAVFAIFYSMLFITIYISGRFELKWLLSGIIAGILSAAVYLFSLLNVGMLALTGIALLVACILFWFLKLRYAMGAIVALIHDVGITMGIFSVLGKEISLPIIAALLTIIGYSLNDTIIVYDRIRENLKKYNKNPLYVTVNRSVNETLSRTILTSGTTLIAVLSLLILGGGIIHDFAFAMTIGIVVGTYSSIYVASPILIEWDEHDKRK